METADDLARAIDRIGAPGVLKTARDGYDGKGQWRIASSREAEAIRLPHAPCVYEGWVEFAAEFSVILVRGRTGEVRFWDSTENRHAGGILAQSLWPPCAAVAAQVEPARALAAKVAHALGYVGVLTLEFFATSAGPVFNEMAPRVHNSGHWTIEGAATSQFENHVRAICGLPLGDTATLVARAVMDNIIGDVSQAHAALADPAAHLHLYGKAEAREGRKMGHVTRAGQGREPPRHRHSRARRQRHDRQGRRPAVAHPGRSAAAEGADARARRPGRPMIMGRKTFESLPGLLPGRRHVVLTRSDSWHAEGAEVAHGAQAALALAGKGDVFVIGGAEIYRLLLPHATRIELTEVHAEVEGDTRVPPFGPEWREVARADHPAEGERPAFSFVTLERAA